MLAVSIQATGKTVDDVHHALLEIMSRLTDGFTSGFDSSSEGTYTFDVIGNDENEDES